MTVYAMPVLAQDAPAEEAAVDSLDEIVVTASGRDKTQLNSSVSVTSINSQLIEDFKPSSESELYRMIPGIQVAGFGGEIAATVAEHTHAKVARLGAPRIPVGYAPTLEAESRIGAAQVVQAARRLLAR